MTKEELNDAIKKSRCFGIAFDSTEPQCKVCEAKTECKSRTEGVLPLEPKESGTEPKSVPQVKTYRPEPRPSNPTPQKEVIPENKEEIKIKKEKKVNPPSSPKKYDPAMPKSFGENLEEKVKFAVLRGVPKTEIDRILGFDNPKICTMWITNAIKKTYLVE